MDGHEKEQLLALAKEAARAAGAELLARFRRLPAAAISQKGHADYVSEADMAAERAILKVLSKAGNEFGFLGEETGRRSGTRPGIWVVDPLDGTSNFIWGIPYFSVSIALCDDDGEILGVVFDPVHDEMFSAIKGQGAWLGYSVIGPLPNKSPDQAMVSISLPVPGQLQCISQDMYLIGLKKVMRDAAGVRRLGSAALDLAYIGAGRLDGYFEDGLSYYDIAAGKLIALESGVIVTNAKGDDTREGAVVAAPAHIHEWLMNMFGLGSAVGD
jgi:myo-inositol-1(or 4)-monophosphatase